MQVASKVSWWHHNSATIFRLVRQCIFRARSILLILMVPQVDTLIYYGGLEPNSINFGFDSRNIQIGIFTPIGREVVGWNLTRYLSDLKCYPSNAICKLQFKCKALEVIQLRWTVYLDCNLVLLILNSHYTGWPEFLHHRCGKSFNSFIWIIEFVAKGHFHFISTEELFWLALSWRGFALGVTTIARTALS